MNISFLIPVYNVAPYLDACLDSILPALVDGDEVVLVNDGSTDDSGERCEQWQARHPDLIKVIHQANQGLAATRNRALAEASCDHVYFIDSDDLLCAETFEPARAALTATDVDVLTLDAWIWYEDRPHSEMTRVGHSLATNPTRSKEAVLEATFRDDFLSSSSRIFRRSLLIGMGPDLFPPGKTYEDNATVPRIIMAATSVGYLPMPAFKYRIRPGSITQQHTVPRCVDQGSSFKAILPLVRHGRFGLDVEREANLLAVKHLVRAVRNAAFIPSLRAADIKRIIHAGLATLTLPPESLLCALASRGQHDLLRHLRGMISHRNRYVAMRMLAARWRHWRNMLRRRRAAST